MELILGLLHTTVWLMREEGFAERDTKGYKRVVMDIRIYLQRAYSEGQYI